MRTRPLPDEGVACFRNLQRAGPLHCRREAAAGRPVARAGGRPPNFHGMIGPASRGVSLVEHQGDSDRSSRGRSTRVELPRWPTRRGRRADPFLPVSFDQPGMGPCLSEISSHDRWRSGARAHPRPDRLSSVRRRSTAARESEDHRPAALQPRAQPLRTTLGHRGERHRKPGFRNHRSPAGSQRIIAQFGWY
jgi:hypothetical protein